MSDNSENESLREANLSEINLSEINTSPQLTFNQLFLTLISRQENLDKLNITLSPEIQKYLLILCKESPEFFTYIETSLRKIIFDNKIDTKDIPEIIILVTKLYTIVQQKYVKNVDPYEVIKQLLHISFVLYIELNNVKNTELASEMVGIIDSAIDLIKLQRIKIPKFGCFKKLFSK